MKNIICSKRFYAALAAFSLLLGQQNQAISFKKMFLLSAPVVGLGYYYKPQVFHKAGTWMKNHKILTGFGLGIGLVGALAFTYKKQLESAYKKQMMLTLMQNMPDNKFIFDTFDKKIQDVKLSKKKVYLDWLNIFKNEVNELNEKVSKKMSEKEINSILSFIYNSITKILETQNLLSEEEKKSEEIKKANSDFDEILNKIPVDLRNKIPDDLIKKFEKTVNTETKN